MDKRDQIYNTTLKLFIRNGYGQTSMSQIASAVGLTKAGLYHYFKTKEELLFLIHERSLKKQLLPLLRKAEKIGDPRERIAFFIKTLTTKTMATDASVKVLVHEIGNLKPLHRKKVQAVWKRALDLIRNALSEIEENGTELNLNKTFAAFAAMGMCCWTIYWFDYDKKESADELADTYLKIFLNNPLSNQPVED